MFKIKIGNESFTTKTAYHPKVIEDFARMKGARRGTLVQVEGRSGRLVGAWLHGFLEDCGHQPGYDGEGE